MKKFTDQDTARIVNAFLQVFLLTLMQGLMISHTFAVSIVLGTIPKIELKPKRSCTHTTMKKSSFISFSHNSPSPIV